MKNISIAFLGFSTSLFLTSCNTKSTTKSASDKVQLADNLKTIVQQENADFYKKDLALWSQHFVHSNAVYWTCVEDDVTLRATGWDDLNQLWANG